MFTLLMSRGRNSSALAALLICTLVLPYASAATCDCHKRVADAENCHTSDATTITKVSTDHRCDAMMACCLIKLAPLLNANTAISNLSIDTASGVSIPTILSAIIQAPPKPPPKAWNIQI